MLVYETRSALDRIGYTVRKQFSLNPVTKTDRLNSIFSQENCKFVTRCLFLIDGLFHIQLELIGNCSWHQPRNRSSALVRSATPGCACPCTSSIMPPVSTSMFIELLIPLSTYAYLIDHGNTYSNLRERTKKKNGQMHLHTFDIQISPGSYEYRYM